ncbi:MAG: MarR family transcriptional regulator [Lachnospiraceae bacterium]|nr:MarR family transcriptional regulator [Lachnospiraceae bacterium]MBQ2115397.1 MarR family transcriptional regulator [Lachnospiraceae bacterium]MBQ2405975.1 MarR family transcriptional regulator [Lachnospiraceae bacterium]MEE0918810.1 MarR family transcriptional regulator [Lachnospiraceae bacterium]
MKIDKQEEVRMQEDFFAFIDEIRELLSSDIWNNILLNCSKNEVFVFWLLYRKENVNMTEIAEYIHVPLNTATGIIAKMEKKGYIIRDRLKEDKRVVVVRLTEQGIAQVKALVDEITYYAVQTITEFSQEEMQLFFRMAKRFTNVLKKERKKEEQTGKVRKIAIE